MTTTLPMASGGSESSLGLLILLVPLALIGFMIWNQRRQTREFARAQKSLELGDEVSTTSGLLGTLVDLDDQVASIEIADGVVVRFDRRAVVPRTVTAATGGAAGTDDTSTEDTDGKA